jgi:UDP-N-acetyl-D-mannosaminuronic acid dehydrogenase
MGKTICIIGGVGHVGLPLGIVFANHGFTVTLYDRDTQNIAKVNAGDMPFIEYGAAPLLNKAIQDGLLKATDDPGAITASDYIVIALGTPMDEYQNPKVDQFLDALTKLKPYLNPRQIIIIRSSVFPKTCDQVMRRLGEESNWDVAYCPERIVQGFSIRELENLPQIVSGFSDRAIQESKKLFSRISKKIVVASVAEAELAKLFTNSWRYIQFAVANQLFMIAESHGEDYYRIRHVMMDGYERAEGLPSAGFTGGPCLLKDTAQVSAYSGNNFFLGQIAMSVNEGVPGFIVQQLKESGSLSGKKVGILGMAFKGDVDDVRGSLSFKLAKLLRFEGARVLCSDEFIDNPAFVSTKEILKKSEVLIIGAPHSKYRHLEVPASISVVDIWNLGLKKEND